MADTLQQLFRERAEQDTVAVKYGDRTWTWREHVAEARAQAAALIDIAEPDRPAARRRAAGQRPDMVTAMAAAALGGYVLCCINNTRRGDGLARDIALVDCQMLITDAAHRHLLDGLDLPGSGCWTPPVTEWAALIAGPGNLTPHREVGPDDTFVMIFTSGTSGDPKAVQVQHMMPIFAGNSLAERYSVDTPMSAMCRCRCSTPTPSTRAGALRWRPVRRWCPRVLGFRFSRRHPPLRRHVHELRRQAARLHPLHP